MKPQFDVDVQNIQSPKPIDKQSKKVSGKIQSQKSQVGHTQEANRQKTLKSLNTRATGHPLRNRNQGRVKVHSQGRKRYLLPLYNSNYRFRWRVTQSCYKLLMLPHTSCTTKCSVCVLLIASVHSFVFFRLPRSQLGGVALSVRKPRPSTRWPHDLHWYCTLMSKQCCIGVSANTALNHSEPWGTWANLCWVFLLLHWPHLQWCKTSLSTPGAPFLAQNTCWWDWVYVFITLSEYIPCWDLQLLSEPPSDVNWRCINKNGTKLKVTTLAIYLYPGTTPSEESPIPLKEAGSTTHTVRWVWLSINTWYWYRSASCTNSGSFHTREVTF